MSSPSQYLDEFFSHPSRLAAVAGRITRGLTSAAVEEILSAAIIAVCEHRGEFNPTLGEGHIEGRLATWFAERVRAARWNFLQGILAPNQRGALAKLIAADDSDTQTESLLEKLSPKQCKAIAALADGGSVREVAALTDLNRGEIRALKKRLRWELRTNPDFLSTVRSPRQPPNVDTEHRSDEHQGSIDHQIAAYTSLEFPPHHGKECTPCVSCLWFEGYRPADRRRVHAEIADAEVREAQRAIYERKLIISATRRGERIEPPLRLSRLRQNTFNP